jgi:transposase
MFIRRTRTGTSPTGKPYFTYRLVESRREGAKVRQVTLLNLGRNFDVDREYWSLLCSRIGGILSGQGDLFSGECPAHVEEEAQRIAMQLLACRPASELTEKTGVDIQPVDVNSLEMTRPRTVGVEHAALWAMEQVRFLQLLEEIGLNGPQRAAAIGLIVGRMAEPGSELATHGWLCRRSGLGELIDTDFETMSLMQLYRASDLMMRKRDILESRLFSRVHDLFGLSCTVTLYDLTNTYFEGEAAGNPKAMRGHSKEKRSDAPLLTLGLVLDGSGFVKRSEIFSGNAGEAGTLQEMLAGLSAPEGALVVMDRGIASEENIAWLAGHGYRYIVVSRERHRQFDPKEAISIETASKEKIQIQKVLSEDGSEVRLYCYSEARAKKEEGITRRFTERFEAGLEKIAQGLTKPRTTKRIDKIRERIGRLKAKSRGVGRHYKIEIIPDETGKKAAAIRWEKQPSDGTMLTHPGVYSLRSNETTWDEERLWRTYIMLTDLEAVFRSLKSELGLRPVYHRKEIRSDGHLFITVLAYQFVQIIRRRLQAGGITDNWRTLRKTLGNQSRVTVTFRREDGRTLNVRKATRPEPEQQRIYEALGLDPNPGGVKKLLV